MDDIENEARERELADDIFVQENYPEYWHGQEIVDFVGDPDLTEELKQLYNRRLNSIAEDPYVLFRCPNIVQLTIGTVQLRHLRGDFVYVPVMKGIGFETYMVRFNNNTLIVNR